MNFNTKLTKLNVTFLTAFALIVGLVLGNAGPSFVDYVKKNVNYSFTNNATTTATGTSLISNSFGNIFSVSSSRSSLLEEVEGLMNKKFISWRATYTPPTNVELEQGMVSGYLGSFKDPYTQYFPPAEAKNFMQNIKGSFGGVGMEVGDRDGYITVIAPLKDSPAMKAGIKAGDILIKIDGKDISGMSVEKAVAIIRGDVGTEVTLTVLHKGAKAPSDVKIIRDEIKVPTLDTEVKNGYFVIHLYSFSAESPELFRQALIKFVDSKSNKMIIDLRGNPGGYLESAVAIASMFLEEGKVVVSEKGNKEYGENVHRSKGYNTFGSNLKLYVLVDNGSASASEILAGALKDQGIAKVAGFKTYGKGSVQELVELKNGGSVKITVANWYTPNGISITEHGVTPDIELKRTDKTTYDSELVDFVKTLK